MHFAVVDMSSLPETGRCGRCIGAVCRKRLQILWKAAHCRIIGCFGTIRTEDCQPRSSLAVKLPGQVNFGSGSSPGWVVTRRCPARHDIMALGRNAASTDERHDPETCAGHAKQLETAPRTDSLSQRFFVCGAVSRFPDSFSQPGSSQPHSSSDYEHSAFPAREASQAGASRPVVPVESRPLFLCIYYWGVTLSASWRLGYVAHTPVS